MKIEEVIKHCKLKNQMAQSMLFDMHYPQMYNLSMRILFNHYDVEDVLIIAFTKVFDKIKKFEDRGNNSLNKWIKTIVINESIRRVNGRSKVSYDEFTTEHETLSDYETAIIDVDIEQIYSIIEALPEGYRMVFNLFAIEGYSHKEISELLKISENTSKSQLRKARINIIERIKKTNEYGNASN